MEIRKVVVPEFVFGQKSRFFLNRYAENLGARRIFIVTDQGIEEAGWVKELTSTLKEGGIDPIVYNAVSPNPTEENVRQGLALYKKEKCDVITAIGGGSPIDCAKGIAVVSTNSGDILDFEGVDEIPMPGPPLICIPSTAGSAADVSQFAIIKDSLRKLKIAIISKTVVPDVSLIDPEVTMTMSTELTAQTGLDALCHAFESYVSNASSVFTDIHAIKAAELISGNLIDAVTQGDDINYRSHMMNGSMLAGIAFSNASLGIVHAMAHSLGGLLDLPHGECNALLLEHAVRYNFTAEQKKYTELAAALGIDVRGKKPEQVCDLLTSRLNELRTSAGVGYGLRDMGIVQGDIEQLARYAVMDPCLATNPRKAEAGDIKKIYEQAL